MSEDYEEHAAENSLPRWNDPLNSVEVDVIEDYKAFCNIVQGLGSALQRSIGDHVTVQVAPITENNIPVRVEIQTEEYDHD